MNRILPIFLAVTAASCTTTGTPEGKEITSLIDQQYEAYQRKDLDRLVEMFAEDAKYCMVLPVDQCVKGKSEIRNRFAKFFSSVSSIKVHVDRRITDGNYVLDWENVAVVIGEKETKFSGISVYSVEAGKISSLYIFTPKGESK